MSKKFDAIKDAVFYAHEKPDALANLLAGAISDVATSIVISGADTVEIPSGDTPNTETYTAKVFSQFGDEMTGTSATLALKESVTGVSISSGVVSVAKTASAGTFIVKATSGTAVAEMTVTMTAGT